ncbi:MarR family transcriptional regulator [Sphingomonas sp. C3-2]|uniref:MarR family winged helix-turn-helix transcriptional regulator n=1 Tax=Sphingomonas sp. C3-2 TaxID=3062169 RepID=UPI00294AE8A7|nr:MarR family transcriptional regulator [Sphingomonas sp. C3-2]WOK37021.1 MarR family transcriptional regulator [Sphingomonas sp. C3-2]
MDSTTQSLGFLLADAARLVRRNFDERARSIGVTGPQWRVLTALIHHEGIYQSRLADLIEVEPISLCRMVDRLQESALVERRPSPSDRRAWQLFLTEKARTLVAQLREPAYETLSEALEGLNEAERQQLAAALERIRLNLSRKPAVSDGASNG